MRQVLQLILGWLLIVQLVNCQSNGDDNPILDEGSIDEDGRSFEGDVVDKNSKDKDEVTLDDKKKQVEAKLAEQDDLRPRSHFTEERFSQLFVPRNSRRKLVSPRYATKPKPTLPSFIKKPISVPPPDVETPATRLSSFSSLSSSSSSSSSSGRSRTTSTTTTTPRPAGRGRNRGSSSSSTTSTTESSFRRNGFSTRKPVNKLFPNRNRN